MKKINFSIGSNNDTHEIETDKALAILSAHYEGMSVSEIVGYWKGQQEKTLLVAVVCDSVDYTKVKRVCAELNTALNQEMILVEIVDTNALFISDRI